MMKLSLMELSLSCSTIPIQPPLSTKRPQLLQLSRDIKGPWKVRFEGLGTGLYPSHLNICSCHRLLTRMSQSQVEEALKLVTDMPVTVYECHCPGVAREYGTDFKLALVWQLPTNPRQFLKRRYVLVRPQNVKILEKPNIFTLSPFLFICDNQNGLNLISYFLYFEKPAILQAAGLPAQPVRLQLQLLEPVSSPTGQATLYMNLVIPRY